LVVVEEELARTPLPSPVRSNASASSSVAARQVPGREGRRMMAFALGFCLGLGLAEVLADGAEDVGGGASDNEEPKKKKKKTSKA